MGPGRPRFLASIALIYAGTFRYRIGPCFNTKIKFLWGATIAQWICLSLPSCRPGYESQAHHLYFFNYSICAIFVMC